jgi:hypothetical protein
MTEHLSTAQIDAWKEEILETENRSAIYLPVSNEMDTKSEDQDDAYWAAQRKDTAQLLREYKEKIPREYDEIVQSLDNPHLRPGAPWGFIVIRTIYGTASEEPWNRMLELLHTTVAESLEVEGYPQLLPCHDLTIIEDEAKLAGADQYTVCDAFCAWVANDLTPRVTDEDLKSHGGAERIRIRLVSNESHGGLHPVQDLTPRWKFCLAVDEDCLRSLQTNKPVVRLLTTEWDHDRDNAGTGTWHHGWDCSEIDEDPVEVGWMYMEVIDYVTKYRDLMCVDWTSIWEGPPPGLLDKD